MVKIMNDPSEVVEKNSGIFRSILKFVIITCVYFFTVVTIAFALQAFLAIQAFPIIVIAPIVWLVVSGTIIYKKSGKNFQMFFKLVSSFLAVMFVVEWMARGLEMPANIKYGTHGIIVSCLAILLIKDWYDESGKDVIRDFWAKLSPKQQNIVFWTVGLLVFGIVGYSYDVLPAFILGYLLFLCLVLIFDPPLLVLIHKNRQKKKLAEAETTADKNDPNGSKEVVD